MAGLSPRVRQIVAAASEKYSRPTEPNEDVVEKDLGELRAICESLKEAALLASALAPERMPEFAGAAGVAKGIILGSYLDDDEFDDE